MWQFIGWLILVMMISTLTDRVDRLCEAQGIDCYQEKTND